MKISARNILRGKIEKVVKGALGATRSTHQLKFMTFQFPDYIFDVI